MTSLFLHHPENAKLAVVAEEAGNNMLQRLEMMKIEPKVIIDLGCGVGILAKQLAIRYPKATVLAIDNSYDMLQHVQNAIRIHANADSLPLANQSVDFIFANFLLPWCHSQANIFNEWSRVLRSNGLLMFTCLGPDTLREVQTDVTNIPNRVDLHELGDALVQSKFSDPVLDVEYLTVTYQDKKKLYYELKATGMLNTKCTEINVEKNAENLFPVTYEIVYGHAWGSSLEGYSADETGVVKIPLAHLRRR